MFAKLMQRYSKGNLILQICVGIVLGIFVGLLSKDVAVVANFLGILFTSALKAIAPMLVFILILTSICTKDFTQKSAKMKNIAFL